MWSKGLMLFVFLWALQEAGLALNVRKYVDHKDMSEYCKRRVIPSMFLGKHVKDGNLNLIYFSKLELPYSCMLTVRTESGNNIILVIQLVTELDLKDACSRNENQLIVYELGETFGGYWGPLSDEVVSPTTTNKTKYYTLKTTPPSTTSSTMSSEEDEHEEITVPLTGTAAPTNTMEMDKYITIDVPLVNISGNLQLAGRPYQLVDEMFDAVYDVTPRKSVEYSTTLMPLVKISIHEQVEGRSGPNRNTDLSMGPLYDLDYGVGDEDFTLDPRLLFRTAHKMILTKKSKWSENRRLHFSDKNVKKISKSTRLMFNRLFTKQKESKNKFSHTIKPHVEDPRINNGRTSVSTTYWYFLDDIMKSYNVTPSAMWENTASEMLLENISNIKMPNISAYLFSNLSHYKGRVIDDEISTKNKEYMEVPTTKFNELSLLGEKDYLNITSTVVENSTDAISLDNNRLKETRTTKFNTARKFEKQKSKFAYNEINIKNPEYNGVKNAQEDVTDSNYETSSIYVTEEKHISTTTPKAPTTGSLVDHESWENIVRVAPVLATVLNKTGPFGINSDKHTNTNDERGNKSKRYVEALSFESFEPKALTMSTPRAPVITESGYMFSDMQDLANLIEIQDDEIQGRIALRYLRNYIGPVLYNICDFEHSRGARHVHLLNSSRIVISINNFTLDRMMLVVTPALALLNTKAQCPPSHIECQILGTRVCVDSINSCDGVPNCGSNDIYDEDRIMCGFSASAQYVIFAAFAFLVVVLTMVYIIHYWLMRCVPRVSEAFFIYADESENTLRLRTSMRAPMDDDDSLQTFYLPGTFSDDDLVCQDIMVKKNENLCMRMLRNFFYCDLSNKKKGKCIEKLKEEHRESELLANNIHHLGRVIQRNNTEPQKITLKKEKATQTRKSLEDNIFNNNINYGIEVKCLDLISDDQFNELSLIKLINERRSTLHRDSDSEYGGIKENSKEELTLPEEETELQSTLYERREDPPAASRYETFQKMQLKPYDEESVEKHLRFTEEPTYIPDLTDDDELQQSYSNVHNQPSFSDINFEQTEANNRQGAKEESNDHKNFWSRPKGKKSKNKNK